MSLKILTGDCREVLKTLPDESVQCCVTSPPYWGLRDYGVSGQLGLEATPEAYVAAMMDVFAEVWRVLRDDGTLWLNLGDSYFGGGRGGNPSDSQFRKQATNAGSLVAATKIPNGFKAKDLVGIPWRVAFALQEAGWYLRQDIIWSKPSCMPESVTDRCTKSHEYVFLMTKSSIYYFDHESIKEPCSDSFMNDSRWETGATDANNKNGYDESRAQNPKRVHRIFNSRINKDRNDLGASNVGGDGRMLRNKRSVWTVMTANFSDAHFATFPPALVKPCILAGTKPGDVVLDPFGGSGTTGMVALELARKAILIELNPEYASMADQRCNITHGLPL